MTEFVTIPVAELPKREPKTFDRATADALLAAVQNAPVESGASDGTSYKTEGEARKVAQKHKRLLSRVTPDGKVARSRVFEHPSGKGFAWAVLIADKPAEKDGDAASA